MEKIKKYIQPFYDGCLWEIDILNVVKIEDICPQNDEIWNILLNDRSGLSFSFYSISGDGQLRNLQISQQKVNKQVKNGKNMRSMFASCCEICTNQRHNLSIMKYISAIWFLAQIPSLFFMPQNMFAHRHLW